MEKVGAWQKGEEPLLFTLKSSYFFFSFSIVGMWWLIKLSRFLKISYREELVRRLTYTWLSGIRYMY